MTAWPSRDRGRGSRGVILVVWRCPDGCAQAAGIHVMGVGEVAHHERAYLAARRSPYGCAQAAGIQVMGAGEAASHGTAQYGHGRVQVVSGKGG